MLSPNPEYQRGAVWNPPQQKRLVDSVMRGSPIPLLYLHHIKKQVAGANWEAFEMIDGQQRLAQLPLMPRLPAPLSLPAFSWPPIRRRLDDVAGRRLGRRGRILFRLGQLQFQLRDSPRQSLDLLRLTLELFRLLRHHHSQFINQRILAVHPQTVINYAKPCSINSQNRERLPQNKPSSKDFILRVPVSATDASAFTFKPRERATSQARVRLAESESVVS